MIEDYTARQKEWSAKTFGPGLRTVGVTEHIKKELAEILEAPQDLEEWVDVIILALDGYWRAGGRPRDIMTHLQAKQDINFARAWPSPPPPENEPSLHLAGSKQPTNAEILRYLRKLHAEQTTQSAMSTIEKAIAWLKASGLAE